jgi:hypothetical protein
MPKMNPLAEWTCDTCHKSVTVENGVLEWLSSPKKGPNSFRVVHSSNNCRRHAHDLDCSDAELQQFVGPDGLQNFLSMLAIGPILDPNGKGRNAPDMASFVDTVRRLQIPLYEEARHYFGDAMNDGYFSDQNEYTIFLPRTCEAIIQRYE